MDGEIEMKSKKSKLRNLLSLGSHKQKQDTKKKDLVNLLTWILPFSSLALPFTWNEGSWAGGDHKITTFHLLWLACFHAAGRSHHHITNHLYHFVQCFSQCGNCWTRKGSRGCLRKLLWWMLFTWAHLGDRECRSLWWQVITWGSYKTYVGSI